MVDLIVSELTKEFPTPSGPLRILQGINFQLVSGESLAVVGPSGCGKSTLLHLLGTLDSPTSGSIRLGGRDPFGLPPRELAKFRNEQMGFIFQEHHLLPQLTALENVLIPVLAGEAIDSTHEQHGLELLSRVGLGDRATHRPAELSGGERQRVAVARALIRNPPLLLADEPTGSLDEHNAASIGELLMDVQRHSGAMLICVTHSSALSEKFQKRVRLNHGRFQEA